MHCCQQFIKRHFYFVINKCHPTLGCQISYGECARWSCGRKTSSKKIMKKVKRKISPKTTRQHNFHMTMSVPFGTCVIFFVACVLAYLLLFRQVVACLLREPGRETHKSGNWMIKKLWHQSISVQHGRYWSRKVGQAGAVAAADEAACITSLLLCLLLKCVLLIWEHSENC